MTVEHQAYDALIAAAEFIYTVAGGTRERPAPYESFDVEEKALCDVAAEKVSDAIRALDATYEFSADE